MIVIDLKMVKDIKKILGRYEEKVPIVLYRALNRAATKARTVSTKEAKDEYNIKSKDVRKTISINKARRNMLGALVISRGEHMSLDKFKYKPRKPRPSNPPKSLKVAVKRDGYKELKHAFVADVYGNKIFKRVSKRRLPIKRMMTLAIPQMIDNEEVRGATDQEVVNTFYKRLDHEIHRVLERGK